MASQPSQGSGAHELPPIILPDGEVVAPESNSQPTTTLPTSTPSQYATQPTRPTARKKTTVADLIIRIVIEHGEEVIFDNVEREDGKSISLNIAQYIKYDMGQDGLSFSEPLYNRILDIAVEQSKEKDFKAGRYFTMHPDYEMSSLAIDLTNDVAMISDSMRPNPSTDELREQVNHLLLDYRNEYINQQMTGLAARMRAANGDAEKIKQIMAEMREVQQVRRAIAKRIGGSISPLR
jgi:DNA primase